MLPVLFYITIISLDVKYLDLLTEWKEGVHHSYMLADLVSKCTCASIPIYIATSKGVMNSQRSHSEFTDWHTSGVHYSRLKNY